MADHPGQHQEPPIKLYFRMIVFLTFNSDIYTLPYHVLLFSRFVDYRFTA